MIDMYVTFHGATFSLIYLREKKLKIIIIKFYKIVKILQAPRLVKINCYRGQVSKETLVLRRWESIAGNLVSN